MITEPKQLLGFEDYIVRNELVDARYAKFYRMWVERFRRFAESGSDSDPERARRRFLEQLKHDSRTADWQLRQARIPDPLPRILCPEGATGYQPRAAPWGTVTPRTVP